MFSPQPVLARQEIMAKLGDENIIEPRTAAKTRTKMARMTSRNPSNETPTTAASPENCPRGQPQTVSSCKTSSTATSTKLTARHLQDHDRRDELTA